VTGGGGATKGGEYPTSFVERPLVLPPMLMQPEFNVGIQNASIAGQSATGESLNFGFDMGVIDKVQAGVLLTFPVNPNADFGSFVIGGQYNVMDFLNARVDLGAAKLGDSTGFTFGIGAPVKYKVSPMVALTSGRPYSYGFSYDIITFAFINGAKAGILTLPVGVLVQPHEMIGLQLRTGVRVGFADASGTAVPLGIDAMVNIIKIIDVGVSFDLAGSTDDYAASKTVGIWAQARLGG
jgi:hypothetical protein